MKKKATTRKAPPAAPATDVDPAFRRVADAFARTRDVTFGKLMASFGLKVNGKIFAMQSRGRFVAKLPKARVDELVGSGQGDYFDPGHGRLMKEWVSLTGDAPDWVELAREAHAFVKGQSK
jgi:TfoX/Sxy family transcriptional regulator of competence genes